MRLALSRVVVAAVVLGVGARMALAETLGEGWPWRRAVVVKQIASDAPGENVAWVEFYANGAKPPAPTAAR